MCTHIYVHIHGLSYSYFIPTLILLSLFSIYSMFIDFSAPITINRRAENLLQDHQSGRSAACTFASDVRTGVSQPMAAKQQEHCIVLSTNGHGHKRGRVTPCRTSSRSTIIEQPTGRPLVLSQQELLKRKATAAEMAAATIAAMGGQPT